MRARTEAMLGRLPRPLIALGRLESQNPSRMRNKRHRCPPRTLANPSFERTNSLRTCSRKYSTCKAPRRLRKASSGTRSFFMRTGKMIIGAPRTAAEKSFSRKAHQEKVEEDKERGEDSLAGLVDCARRRWTMLRRETFEAKTI